MPSLRDFIQREIEGVSNVKVPLSPANTICFDNEAFRYLVLTKNLSEAEAENFDELQEHKTFCRSWDMSSQASEKLISYAQQLPVLNMAEVVSYNQSRTLSVDLVEQVIEALVKLCKQAERCQANSPSRQKIEQQQEELIEKAAAITGHLSSRAVTIFNDHLDAHMEEKIAAFKSSVLEDLSSLAQRMEVLRACYQNAVGSFCSQQQIFDVDASIRELHTLLNTLS